MADVTSPFGFPYPEDTDLVRDGAQDIENLATGVNDYLTGGYLYAGTIYYTSSGNFVKADPFGTGDIGLRAIRVRMVGGGGGGGGAPTTGAGQASIATGGGGACYAERFILASALASSETVTVGSGGSGGAEGANNGSNGGTSEFGAFLTAGGGGLGRAVSAQTPPTHQPRGGTGGTAVTGHDFRIFGSAAANGFIVSATIVFPTLPGASHLGAMRGENGTTTGANGAAGHPFGGGGTGGLNAENQSTARSGGNGAGGIVIIDIYV